MAEHRVMSAAQFAEMKERHNKRLDRFDFLLELLLEKRNCSPSSFRGATNSCQETLQQPFRSNHIYPVNPCFSELLREFKQSRTRWNQSKSIDEQSADESGVTIQIEICSSKKQIEVPAKPILESSSSLEPDLDNLVTDESVGVRTSMVIEVSESMDTESLLILKEIGSEVDAGQSIFVEVVTPASDLIEEQSIVDESIAVRNLTVEEVMSMSEILDKPLVYMHFPTVEQMEQQFVSGENYVGLTMPKSSTRMSINYSTVSSSPLQPLDAQPPYGSFQKMIEGFNAMSV